MVEVFKTNVCNPEHAKMLLEQIHQTFTEYKANFDLDDSDRILRVSTLQGTIAEAELILLLKDYGFQAEILPDIIDEPIWDFQTPPGINN